MKDLIGRLANQLGLHRQQTERTAALFDEGGTVPFVARYRKEMTGGLDEVKLAEFRERLNALRRLDDRQNVVIESIRDQGKLSADLAEAIEEAETLQAVEDLYLPYKPKRQTRAQKARKRGLEPVSRWILEQRILDEPRSKAVVHLLSDDVPSPDQAWQGARDIVAEVVAEDARSRETVRRIAWDSGEFQSLVSKQNQDERGTYETYYEFSRALQFLKPHQVLAINRGEADKVLKIGFSLYETAILNQLDDLYPANSRSPLANDLNVAVQDGYKRLIRPAIEREIRRDLKAWADEHAISVFATNLRNLLLTPPLRGMTVLGIDPGFRTGCKVAVVDPTGRVLDVGTIYPNAPQNRDGEALRDLDDWVSHFGVQLIAIGNGTASRETESLVTRLIEQQSDLRYIITDEAGASVYSASPLARAELGEMDVSLRGAVSIARRVQDPLSELVKIDPRSIGVGMYQHDVDQGQLTASLTSVIESVVNAVGVDLNTASPALLQHVSGLGPNLAERIVDFREQKGPFSRRDDVMNVKGMGPKAFEQAAGFLRIPDGDMPLDNTGVHPESYSAVRRFFKRYQLELESPDFDEQLRIVREVEDLHDLAEMVGVGVPTLTDIFEELERPGRDPRDEVPQPILRAKTLSMDDLKPGMMVKGTVRNVVDFGAFVDVGVKQDGLIHISEMADHRVNSPYEVVSVGDIVEVRVLNVDLDRGRIGLSLLT